MGQPWTRGPSATVSTGAVSAVGSSDMQTLSGPRKGKGGAGRGATKRKRKTQHKR